MLGVAARCRFLAIERFDAHQAHQRADVTSSGFVPDGSEQVSQHACAGEGIVQMQAVDLAHQLEVGRRDRLFDVVQGATGNLQQFGLAGYGQGVLVIDHRLALASSTRPSARSKKSFSNANWPIFACNSLMSGPAELGLPPSNAIAA